MEKLKRQRRIAVTICGFLIFGTLLLCDRYGSAALLPFIASVAGTAILDVWFSRRLNIMQEQWQGSQPILIEKATVLKRRVAHTFRLTRRGGVSSGRDDWCCTFQMERSGEMEMIVPRDVYLAVTEGQQGLLKHQGRKFYSFQ